MMICIRWRARVELCMRQNTRRRLGFTSFVVRRRSPNELDSTPSSHYETLLA